MYSLFKDTVTVSRLTDSNGKSSFTVSWTYKGLLKPVSANNSLMTTENIGKMYHFTTQYGADIRPTDKIEHNGITYKVQGVSADLRARSLKFTRVNLIKNV